MKVHLSTRKITAHIPESLLASAQRVTGTGITETLKAGLERLQQDEIYKKVLALRGKYNLSYDIESLREDRR